MCIHFSHKAYCLGASDPFSCSLLHCGTQATRKRAANFWLGAQETLFILGEMSEERRERNQQRRPPSSGQNQRLFSSSIRSALGGQKPRNNGRRNNEAQREIRPSYQSIDEALKEVII